MIMNLTSSSKCLTYFTDFLRLQGPPFNCAENVTAYYEIEDCGQIDNFRARWDEPCAWVNGRDYCEELDFKDKNGKYLVNNNTIFEAYIPRNRNTACTSQVMYSVWDHNIKDDVFRTFAANKDAKCKYVLAYFHELLEL